MAQKKKVQANKPKEDKSKKSTPSSTFQDEGRCTRICCRSILLIFVPVLIVLSILFFILWLLMLPIKYLCPCCSICTKAFNKLWKLLAEAPVHLADWVCEKKLPPEDEEEIVGKTKGNKTKTKKKGYGATVENKDETKKKKKKKDLEEKEDSNTSDTNDEKPTRKKDMPKTDV